VKNKLFYFGGYQGTRIKTDPATTISIVPTAQVLTGDFSTILSSACTATPITLRAPFSGNKIAPSQFNPQALYLMKYVPVSTDPCGKYQYGIVNNSEEDNSSAGSISTPAKSTPFSAATSSPITGILRSLTGRTCSLPPSPGSPRAASR
jgi:hypothetical protein